MATCTGQPKKNKTQWFPFLAIMEYTANILDPNKGLITSLLKVFDMFQLRLFNNKEYEEENFV